MESGGLLRKFAHQARTRKRAAPATAARAFRAVALAFPLFFALAPRAAVGRRPGRAPSLRRCLLRPLLERVLTGFSPEARLWVLLGPKTPPRGKASGRVVFALRATGDPKARPYGAHVAVRATAVCVERGTVLNSSMVTVRNVNATGTQNRPPFHYTS